MTRQLKAPMRWLRERGKAVVVIERRLNLGCLSVCIFAPTLPAYSVQEAIGTNLE